MFNLAETARENNVTSDVRSRNNQEVPSALKDRLICASGIHGSDHDAPFWKPITATNTHGQNGPCDREAARTLPGQAGPCAEKNGAHQGK